MNGQTMLYMFCCYAREDKSYCETLNQYLNGLKRQKSLITWSDQEILAGEEWQTAINTQLQKADIIFCLVSPTFLASEHCYGEIEQALKRQKEGSTYVIPILVRPTYWKNTLLEDLQMLPSNAVAIASWPDADEAWLDVIKGVLLVIQKVSLLKRAASEEREHEPMLRALEQTTQFDLDHHSAIPAGLEQAYQAPPTDRNDQQILQGVLPISSLSSTFFLPKQGMFSPRQPTHNQSRRVKRRAVIAGLAGLAATSGSILWFSSTQQGLKRANAVTTSHPTPKRSPSVPIGTLLFTYPEPSGVWSLSWSPDDRQIVSGGLDSIIYIWNTADGGDVSLYREHTDHITQVTWSPSGQAIASTSDDGTFRIWNALNKKDLHTFPTVGVHGHAISWSPDGKLLATGSDIATVQIWNTSTWKSIYTYQGHTDGIWWVTWSPNGHRIASASNDGTVHVWDAITGGHPYIYRGHRSSVWAVAWSPDGTYLASASWDKTVQVWRDSDGAGSLSLYTYQGHTDVVREVEWSSDSRRLVSAGFNTDHTVHVWNALDGENRYVYSKHTDAIGSVKWSHDGTRIASGSLDKTIQIWQAV